MLVVGAENGKIYFIDADNGDPIRSITISSSDPPSPIRGPLATQDGIVYARTQDHFVYAVDISSGAIVWTSPLKR
jgi:outer membrane protein assembly factor BamB